MMKESYYTIKSKPIWLPPPFKLIDVSQITSHVSYLMWSLRTQNDGKSSLPCTSKVVISKAKNLQKNLAFLNPPNHLLFSSLELKKMGFSQSWNEISCRLIFNNPTESTGNMTLYFWNNPDVVFGKRLMFVVNNFTLQYFDIFSVFFEPFGAE